MNPPLSFRTDIASGIVVHNALERLFHPELDPEKTMNPADLKFATSHEWVSIDGDTATVGISDFAVKELTDLTYIELPAVGATVKKGEEFGEVESVKAVSDLYAPVSGEVTEVNSDLEDDLAALSDDAFGKGWIMKVKMSDPSEVESLLDHAAYLKESGQA